MKTLALLWISWLLTACTSAPPPAPPPDALFHDALFQPASTAVDADAALAVSAEMRSYLGAKFHNHIGSFDRRRELVEAIYRHGDLRLEYDATMTRTAAQAFEARSGNCLSLVLMTAAFAKELGLTVHFQAVIGEEAWDRSEDLYIAAGHVNLSLEDHATSPGWRLVRESPLIVDFLPPRAAHTLRTREIGRAHRDRDVPQQSGGRVDDRRPPRRCVLVGARSGSRRSGDGQRLCHAGRRLPHPPPARVRAGGVRAGQRARPGQPGALSNRVLALRDLGRDAEANALAQRLARLDPHPPFSYFQEGMTALGERRFEDARRLFAKEVDRAPYHHEFEFWLAVSYLDLNDPKRAAIHLERAMEISTTRKDHDLYSAKLDRLKALHLQ